METKNLDIYGSDPIPWSRVLQQLETANWTATWWLATAGGDGRPHLAGVGARWLDGKFYFVSGAATRKSRNLAANPVCALSVSLKDIDLVIEGAAERVSDAATLTRLAEAYAAGGWPASVSGESLTAPYSAPSAGPAPWDLYELRGTVAFGVATAEPYGAMRWRF